MAFILVVSLYTSRVVLRTLGVVDFGVYNVVAGFVSMFTFLNSALSSGVQRFFNYELGKNGTEATQKVYVAAFVNQILIAFVIAILVESVGVWYLENKMIIPPESMGAARVLFQLSVASMIVVIMQVPYSAAIMAYERMNYYAIVGIIDVLLKLGIVIVLPHIPYDKLIIYALMSFAITLFDFFLYFIYVKIHFKELKIRFELNKKMITSMLSFSGWHVFGTFAIMMKNQGVNMVLNLFFGPVVNAARGISYQISTAIMGFVQNITTAARPQMIQSYGQGNHIRSINLMYSISKISFIALYLMVLPVSLEIDYILGLWLGNENVPEYTAIFTILVLLISLIDILNTPVSMFVHATGKMRNYQVITSFVSLLILPFGYLAFKLGAAPMTIFIISLTFSFVDQTVSLFILRTLASFSVKEYCKRVVFPLFLLVSLTALVPTIPKLFMCENFARIIIVTLISTITISTVAYFIGLDKKEKELVLSLLSKLKKNTKIKL